MAFAKWILSSYSDLSTTAGPRHRSCMSAREPDDRRHGGRVSLTLSCPAPRLPPASGLSSPASASVRSSPPPPTPVRPRSCTVPSASTRRSWQHHACTPFVHILAAQLRFSPLALPFKRTLRSPFRLCTTSAASHLPPVQHQSTRLAAAVLLVPKMWLFGACHQSRGASLCFCPVFASSSPFLAPAILPLPSRRSPFVALRCRALPRFERYPPFPPSVHEIDPQVLYVCKHPSSSFSQCPCSPMHLPAVKPVLSDAQATHERPATAPNPFRSRDSSQSDVLCGASCPMYVALCSTCFCAHSHSRPSSGSLARPRASCAVCIATSVPTVTTTDHDSSAPAAHAMYTTRAHPALRRAHCTVGVMISARRGSVATRAPCVGRTTVSASHARASADVPVPHAHRTSATRARCLATKRTRVPVHGPPERASCVQRAACRGCAERRGWVWADEGGWDDRVDTVHE